MARREPDRLLVEIGSAVREERKRRGLTLRALASLAGLDGSTVHYVETGRSASLESWVRLSRALRLRVEVRLLDPRRRELGHTRAEDPVHASLGEIEVVRLRAMGFEVAIDEPFQHYQFAGRADVVAWSRERAALLHIENRTQFPNLQEAFGSFNAKKAYLGPELATRAGVPRWLSETHVMVALWSAEVLHEIRLHRASFESVARDSESWFAAWWRGEPRLAGRRSILVVFDPLEWGRRDRRRWIDLDSLAPAKPRYAGYAEALTALRRAGLT